MEIQPDYETDVTMAVFRTSGEAESALRRLEESGVAVYEVRQVELAPGRYDVADTSVAEEASGALRGAEIGVPAGAVVGAGLAVSLLGGTPEVIAGIAGAGALAGGVLGAFEGAVLRTHFDDDVAPVHAVPDEDPEVVLIVHTTGTDGGTANAHRVLLAAGASAFLDATTFGAPTSESPG